MPRLWKWKMIRKEEMKDTIKSQRKRTLKKMAGTTRVTNIPFVRWEGPRIRSNQTSFACKEKCTMKPMLIPSARKEGFIMKSTLFVSPIKGRVTKKPMQKEFVRNEWNITITRNFLDRNIPFLVLKVKTQQVLLTIRRKHHTMNIIYQESWMSQRWRRWFRRSERRSACNCCGWWYE